jgi:hypothetical protein
MRPHRTRLDRYPTYWAGPVGAILTREDRGDPDRSSVQ